MRDMGRLHARRGTLHRSVSAFRSGARGIRARGALWALLVLLGATGGCHSWRDPLVERGALSLGSPPGRAVASQRMGVDATRGVQGASGGGMRAPSVARLREWARTMSPPVRAAEARLAAARARAGCAGRWADPELEGRVLGRDGEVGLEAALRFTLPLNGTTGARGRAAAIALARARSDLSATRFDVECRLALLLSGIRTARSRLRTREEIATRAEAYAELAKQ
ncbi:MAG: hypothetical protein GF330_10200, partial [Candidatus Eisenbacteria bacterium]|nr:hypothetical protein [Candidatus Eisenbacteria bacterium]